MFFFKSKFFRFIVVSVLGGIVDLGVYFGVTKIFSLHYLLAGFLAFVAAATVNFFLAKKWAFRCECPYVRKQFRRYFMVGLGGLMWHQIILMLGMKYLMGWEILVKLLASWATVMWSYFMNRWVTFKK